MVVRNHALFVLDFDLTCWVEVPSTHSFRLIFSTTIVSCVLSSFDFFVTNIHISERKNKYRTTTFGKHGINIELMVLKKSNCLLAEFIYIVSYVVDNVYMHIGYTGFQECS